LPQPATFRPQGLVTLSAAYALRARAGFVSHRRRSWDSPFGASSSRKVPEAFPRPMDPRTVFLTVVPAAEAGAGPASRGFRVCTLSRVPGDRTGISSPFAGCSLGLCPSRVYWRPPGRGFTRLPPTRLAVDSLAAENRWRLGVSIGVRLAPAWSPGKPDGDRCSPSRVFAPVRPEA